MRNGVTRYGKLKAPKWSSSDAQKRSIRTYLPKLQIGKETKIKLNSGIYYLKIKYENKYVNNQATAKKNGHSMKKCEAAIIIGEIAFDSNGFVLAGGAVRYFESSLCVVLFCAVLCCVVLCVSYSKTLN
jgi:hypothetical protein